MPKSSRMSSSTPQTVSNNSASLCSASRWNDARMRARVRPGWWHRRRSQALTPQCPSPRPNGSCHNQPRPSESAPAAYQVLLDRFRITLEQIVQIRRAALPFKGRQISLFIALPGADAATLRQVVGNQINTIATGKAPPSHANLGAAAFTGRTASLYHACSDQ